LYAYFFIFLFFSYNLKTEVKLINSIEERDGFVYPRPGELFARVPLSDQLNDDTDTGKFCWHHVGFEVNITLT
jgi:hypothetical protein